jgi:hypothetical protein
MMRRLRYLLVTAAVAAGIVAATAAPAAAGFSENHSEPVSRA